MCHISRLEIDENFQVKEREGENVQRNNVKL